MQHDKCFFFFFLFWQQLLAAVARQQQGNSKDETLATGNQLKVMSLSVLPTPRVLAAHLGPNNTQHLMLSPKSLSASFPAKSIYSTLQQFKLEDYSLVHTI